MSAPIKREDIRKGDRILRTLTYEYTAASDGQTPLGDAKYEYELIERPAPLPTEPGHYLDKHDEWAYLAADGTWTNALAFGVEESVIASRAPLTRVRPVAEVAAEVLADVRGVFEAYGLDAPFDAIAAKWATK